MTSLRRRSARARGLRGSYLAEIPALYEHYRGGPNSTNEAWTIDPSGYVRRLPSGVENTIEREHRSTAHS